jgi:hypothetical protein
MLQANGDPSQCVAVTPGSVLEFGGWFRNLNGSVYTCSVFTFSGPNCTGTANGIFDGIVFGMATEWTFYDSLVHVPLTDVSLQVTCDANANSLADKMFLSPSGTQF